MLYLTEGYAAPKMGHAIEQATALAEKTGNLTQLVAWTLRKWLAPFNSGDLPFAAALADQTLELAVREGSPRNVAMAHAIQILTGQNRGDLLGADQHYTAGLKFFDDSAFRQVPGAASWTFGLASYNAWLLGRPDVARERMVSIVSAVSENKPYDQAISDICAAQLRHYLKEYEQAEAFATKALERSEKHQFLPEIAHSRCVLGRARAQLGHASEGITLIRQGMDALLKAGLRLTIPTYFGYLAESQQRAGAIADALEAVEQALHANPNALTRRPETLRLRGELRLNQRQEEPAESDFREAIVLAQKMSAKAWELRATMSLARLLAKQGRRDDARAMLANIYDWFTEGFDTADLKDAKTLLDQLIA
jgi:tetratricopeptide (TPR) repeat protein